MRSVGYSLLLAALLLPGCSKTQEIDVGRSAFVVSHVYFGFGWLAIYSKDLDVETNPSENPPR